MEHFFEPIHGWTDESMFKIYREAIVEAQPGAVFVEVGSWMGRSAAYIAVEIINSGKQIKLCCVDTWEGSDENEHREIMGKHGMKNIFPLWEKNLEPVRAHVSPIMSQSVQAAELFADRSIDFCFIDADHREVAVRADIAAWLPKVKPGGILAGHDYENGHPGVNRAVDDIFKMKAETFGQCWRVRV